MYTSVSNEMKKDLCMPENMIDWHENRNSRCELVMFKSNKIQNILKRTF